MLVSAAELFAALPPPNPNPLKEKFIPLNKLELAAADFLAPPSLVAALPKRTPAEDMHESA